MEKVAKKIRLDKFLAHALRMSRKDIKSYLKKGCVLVNTVPIKDNGFLIDMYQDSIYFLGKPVQMQTLKYLMLHKPPGFLSATVDAHAPTVMTLLPAAYQNQGLFIVGRLDKDTEGFLLLTNDGPFAHLVLSPKKKIKKVYYAKVQGIVTEEDVQSFAAGIVLEDGCLCQSAALNPIKIGPQSEIQLTITEGKFHQVKRMFSAIGKPVVYLKRIQIGNLPLDPALSIGQCKELTNADIKKILQESEKEA